MIYPTFETDLRIWPQFVSQDLKKWPKMHSILYNPTYFDTLHNQPIFIDFLTICKHSFIFIFWPKTKIMVIYKTSQYVLLNLVFHMSCLGVFQNVRDILQVTVPIDHPVLREEKTMREKVGSEQKRWEYTGEICTTTLGK